MNLVPQQDNRKGFGYYPLNGNRLIVLFVYSSTCYLFCLHLASVFWPSCIFLHEFLIFTLFSCLFCLSQSVSVLFLILSFRRSTFPFIFCTFLSSLSERKLPNFLSLHVFLPFYSFLSGFQSYSLFPSAVPVDERIPSAKTRMILARSPIFSPLMIKLHLSFCTKNAVCRTDRVYIILSSPAPSSPVTMRSRYIKNDDHAREAKKSRKSQSAREYANKFDGPELCETNYHFQLLRTN